MEWNPGVGDQGGTDGGRERQTQTQRLRYKQKDRERQRDLLILLSFSTSRIMHCVVTILVWAPRYFGTCSLISTLFWGRQMRIRSTFLAYKEHHRNPGATQDQATSNTLQGRNVFDSFKSNFTLSSFCTGKLWNSLPESAFPPSYDLNSFKTHLQP